MFLIVGLGNPGKQYDNTRHNVGFDVIDALADKYNISVSDKKHKALCGKGAMEGIKVVLAKPQTYMNLSGNAVRYWLQQEKIPIENMLVLVDDLNLPFGSIRMRKQGSNGGHNGLGHIQQVLCTQNYARLRFGIGNDFNKGAQCNFVLGQWSEEEAKLMPDRLKVVNEIIPSFCLQGMDRTMNQYNGK